ncbi:PID-CTERM protein-sorting domain-containing protein [Adhaeribacter soli]|uniref:VPEID-CTERM sorting domain-containing protein n=1 Tax=Adhaeribacter soli TaxID=2607655 RepID=A0A5N1ISM4_9BACT|nr:hypothetical protein [Adhaeribacter soli]KAA9331110.1 hypothetical protein F0P94_14510 [Adhaeribacter soli]
MKNNSIKALLSTAFMTVITASAWAQGSPGNGGPTPTDIPIDGGISLLAAGGAALGIHKMRKRFQK